MRICKDPLALNQVPAQAEQRGITTDQVMTDVMMGRSRVKEMMTPIEVGNLFVFGFPVFQNTWLAETFFLMGEWSGPIKKT